MLKVGIGQRQTSFSQQKQDASFGASRQHVERLVAKVKQGDFKGLEQRINIATGNLIHKELQINSAEALNTALHLIDMGPEKSKKGDKFLGHILTISGARLLGKTEMCVNHCYLSLKGITLKPYTKSMRMVDAFYDALDTRAKTRKIN